MYIICEDKSASFDYKFISLLVAHNRCSEASCSTRFAASVHCARTKLGHSPERMQINCWVMKD